jgi:hypothetical protein
MHTHKNGPTQESSQATLARVKKEMDEPRMAASTRENSQPERTAGVGKAAVIQRGKDKESRALRARGDAPEGGK